MKTKEIPVPPFAVPKIKELFQRVQHFQKLKGCEEALKNTIYGIMLSLGIENANLNIEKMVFEVSEKPEKKE